MSKVRGGGDGGLASPSTATRLAATLHSTRPMTTLVSLASRRQTASEHLALDFRSAEETLARMLKDPNLDERLLRTPSLMRNLSARVREAVERAFRQERDAPEAHRFLQRALYRINRLMLFWYDSLLEYENDRSPFVLSLRAGIENAWQSWEVRSIDLPALQQEDVESGLRQRAARDVDPPPSAAGLYFRDHAGVPAYSRLVEIASLDGLVEASQLSRTLGGVSNDVHSTLTRLLLEEYGGGKPARKHSAYFRTMMEALGLDTSPEAHLDLVPWEVLAGINHSFLLSDRKRFFLRYVGGLLYTEVSVPSAFRCYRAAAERLGLPADAMTYWDLHIKEDARHGPWMLDQVALPLAAQYPHDAWELLLGYDQQREISARAGTATARAAAAADCGA